MPITYRVPLNYAPPYAIGFYGQPRVYGIPLYAYYTVEPIGASQTFSANSINYTTILVQWSEPQVPSGVTIEEYRLLQNRYGFPVDQNDGTILMDGTTYFGSQYQDQNVIPGSYHYYGFYLRVNDGSSDKWIRSGFTSCLAIANYNSGSWFFNNLPYYLQSTQDPELTTPQPQDLVLKQYLNVIGWGMDYIKTQYDKQFNTLNNPMQMSLRDLYNLALELGLPFQPEVPAAIMRKAVANWTTVAQQRGTIVGINNAVTLLTGYGMDSQIGVNKFLEIDQSVPVHPSFSPWNTLKAYTAGNIVTNGAYTYTARVKSLGHSPTGNTSQNTWWTCTQDAADPNAILANPNSIGIASGNNTGTANTLEAIYSGKAVSYVPPSANTLTVGIGEPLVSNVNDWQGNTFRITNQAAAQQTIWLRTVSRAPSDLNTANWVQDAQQAVENGVPIPQLTPHNEWNSTTRYKTKELVAYNNVIYQAQRASTNAPPPLIGTPLNANPFFNGVSSWTTTGFSSVTTSPTVTSASGTSFYGTSCLSVSVVNGITNPTLSSTQISVIPNALYEISFWVQSPAVFTNCAQISVTWAGPGGQTSTTSNTAVTIGSPVNTFTKVTYVVTAPAFATAATAELTLVQAFTSSNTFFIANGKFSCWGTPEWLPVSKDGNLRYMLSAQCSQSLLVGTNTTTAVTPFVEWFDSGGNFIQRVFSRTATAGTAAPPTGLSYDTFTTQVGLPMAGRTLDSDDQAWSSVAGNFVVGGYNGGVAYPLSTAVQNMYVINGTANGNVAATFSTPAVTGNPWDSSTTYAIGAIVTYSGYAYQAIAASTNHAPTGTATANAWWSLAPEQAIIFRYSSAGNYYHAGPTALYLYQGTPGTAPTSLGTYSTAMSPGDRMTVNMNGSTITIYRNAVFTSSTPGVAPTTTATPILTVTSSTFNSATIHGIAVEAP